MADLICFLIVDCFSFFLCDLHNFETKCIFNAKLILKGKFSHLISKRVKRAYALIGLILKVKSADICSHDLYCNENISIFSPKTVFLLKAGMKIKKNYPKLK